jgi:hypothetical protein
MNNNNNNNSDKKEFNNVKSLIAQIDWELQKRRPFVVADPLDTNELLYLNDKDYLVLMRTCLRNNENLLVLARPGSKPPEGPLK